MKYCFPSGNRNGKRKKICTIYDTMSIKLVLCFIGITLREQE